MDLITIETLNSHKKYKEDDLYFKQIKKYKNSQIIIINNDISGYICFYIKSRYHIKINNKII